MQFPSSPRLTQKRILIFRRKLDGVVFGLGAATFMIASNVSAAVFGIFLVMGIYLLVFRWKKSLRHLDKTYVLAALLFSAGCLATNLLNGSLPEDMRWSSYPLYQLLVIPVAVGLVLVRDPLRQFVLGTRIGLVIVFLWAISGLALALWGGADVRAGALRFGMGSNAANAAFAIAFLAVFSRLDVKSPPALLSSRRIFFYLAFITVLASQTRAVLPVFMVGLAMDLFSLVRHSRTGWLAATRQNALMSIALLVVGLGSLWVLYPIVSQRVHTTFVEITTTLENPESSTASGISTRLVQWKAAFGLISEHPVLGRGGYGISDAIAEHSAAGNEGDLKRYSFVHNFILDELVQRGIAGLTLTLGFFGYCFYRIYSRGDASMKENVVLVLALTLSFGMLHYLLVIDRHVVLYALYFLLLITANHGWRPPYKIST